MSKRYLKSVLVSISIFSFILGTGAYANEGTKEGIENTVYVSDLTYDKFGNILTCPEQGVDLNNNSSDIMPMANPGQTVYQQTNKKYRGTVKELTQYVTQDWTKASSYSFTTSRTFSSSWSISGNAEVKKAISATGGYTRSVSKSYSVTSVIPANSKKFSKLARETEYDRYTADVYRYRTNGIQSGPKTYVGSATIDSPNSTYLVVKYK